MNDGLTWRRVRRVTAAGRSRQVIAVVGEALIDLVGDVRVDGAGGAGSSGTFHARPGGSPYNVAIGLARLDCPCALLARISTDTFGVQLRTHLERNGVALDHVVDATEPTTLAFAILDQTGSARYEFYVAGTADWQWRAEELPAPLPPTVTALHAGSLALALPPGADVLDDFLRRERARGAVTISVDPNVRPQLATDRAATRDRIERQITCAHLVKVSEEDLAWLYPATPVSTVVEHWRDLGPAAVVVTLGERGAVAVGPDGREIRVTAPSVEVVDTVGAGDAFTAALLAGLDERGLLAELRRPVPERFDVTGFQQVLARAAYAAARTCTRPGADPPTTAELASAGV
jgi:fructokinase